MIFRAFCAFLCLAVPAAAQQAVSEASGAQLRGVDRINGEVFEIIVPSGQTARLQQIDITLRSCRYPVGNPAGDAFASLEISEVTSGETAFLGLDDCVISGAVCDGPSALRHLGHALHDFLRAAHWWRREVCGTVHGDIQCFVIIRTADFDRP